MSGTILGTMDILVHGDEQNSLHPQQQINSINAWKINGDKLWHVVLRKQVGEEGFMESTTVDSD